MNRPIKYVADVKHVREVSLLGVASLDYWSDRLSPQGLVPLSADGRAQILLIAAEMTFKGVRFRELSFSVLLDGASTDSQDRCLLLHAYNSCRLFAFSERLLFSTPYYHGDVRVSTCLPASMKLAVSGQPGFNAMMQTTAGDKPREPSFVGERGWDGPVYLPRSPSDHSGKMFIAKILGHTQVYPFVDGQDVLEINAGTSASVLQDLVDSDFAASEWIIRDDARHAKSRTYACDAALCL